MTAVPVARCNDSTEHGWLWDEPDLHWLPELRVSLMSSVHGKTHARAERVDEYCLLRIWARCHEIVYLHAYLREKSGPLFDEMSKPIACGRG